VTENMSITSSHCTIKDVQVTCENLMFVGLSGVSVYKAKLYNKFTSQLILYSSTAEEL